jgi:hypothetical protein
LTVSIRPPTVPLADSIVMPTGALLASQAGGTTVIASAIATRVTLTAVPSIASSQTGPVAAPRLVWICAVVSDAVLTCRIRQSLHDELVSVWIARSACCADRTETMALVPSGH